MAKVKSGFGLGLSGRFGDHVYTQQPDGSTTISNVPEPSSKPRTNAQHAVIQDTQLCSAFFNPIQYVLKVGFELEKKKGNGNNLAVAHLRKNGGLTGVYPNRQIDYSKVLLSRGKMPPPENAAVTVTDIGFSFTWDTHVEARNTHYSDQVMLVATFPELQKAVFVTGGPQRYDGTALLVPNGIRRGATAQIYMSFMSNNHKSMSNSIYLGEVNW